MKLAVQVDAQILTTVQIFTSVTFIVTSMALYLDYWVSVSYVLFVALSHVDSNRLAEKKRKSMRCVWMYMFFFKNKGHKKHIPLRSLQ